MKKKILFLFLTLIGISMPTKAQLDSWMLNQWLNQMETDTYRQQQKMAKEFLKALEMESERQKKAASVVTSLLPDGNDTFWGYGSLVYISKNEIEVIKIDEWGQQKILPPSSYYFVGAYFFIPAIFTPGNELVIRHKETGKILSTNKIPTKESGEYERFLQNSYISAQHLGMQLQGGSVSIPHTPAYGSQSNSKNTTCSLCGGKGWIAGSKTPTYGDTSRRWCSDCQREVGASHSHDRCPSCSYIRK